MLMILHTSANILIIPDVKSASTVSTSPTNLDTTAPGSCLLRQSAVSLVNLSISPLLNACVIFCPNTVRSASLAASISPVSTISPKYASIILQLTACPAVMASIIPPRINGGKSDVTIAITTADTIASDNSSLLFIVYNIISATLLLLLFWFILFVIAAASCLFKIQLCILRTLLHKLFVGPGYCPAIIHPDYSAHLREQIKSV